KWMNIPNFACLNQARRCWRAGSSDGAMVGVGVGAGACVSARAGAPRTAAAATATRARRRKEPRVGFIGPPGERVKSLARQGADRPHRDAAIDAASLAGHVGAR